MNNSSLKLLAVALIVVVLGAFAYAVLVPPPHGEGGHDAPALKQVQWSFDGMFGTVDRASAQRGYQVYKEVCASCHAMKRIPFRTLEDIGFSKGEVKAIAASYQIKDGPGDDGEMFERPGLPSDSFVSPFANEQASRASNGGAYPPDLSLIVKARPDGANYVFSLITGYEAAPADVKMNEGMHYNKYFAGHQIAMAPPLADGQVSYGDGTNATTEQMAKDVTNFLQWAAEPEMEARKRMGIKVLIFLALMTGFLYVAKRRIWNKLH